ncbi:MAG TPA: carotenoid biosynthesis protein [Nitrososphaerales archaeon]|nr:carotenoid biosynthesis protein [Nitrososphaerales archaeon]
MTIAIPIFAELAFVFIAAAVFYAGTRRYGAFKTGIFLAGSVLWTAPLENFAVIKGAYTYYSYAGVLLPNYPGYLMWVGLVPLWIVLGWFVFAMSGFLIFHNVVLPGRRALFQAAASGLFALNIDLMMDPIASSNGLWIWTQNIVDILGVPLFNFVGWFLLIFFYDLIAEHTIFNNKPLKVVSKLEVLIPLKYRGGGGPNPRLFVFRVIILEIFLIVFLTVLNDVLSVI